MACVLSAERIQDSRQTVKADTRASFFSSQIILFNSRKKYGLLYSIATTAGLFCVPGILGVMGSETEMQLLIQRTFPLPFITLLIAVGMYILNDLVDADVDRANSKNRPIPSGLVSKKQTWSFIILTNGAALGLLIVTFTLASFILVVPMMLIGLLYSMPKKTALMNRFLLKNLSIAIFFMLCSLLGMISGYGIELVFKNPVVSIHTVAMSGIMIFVGSIVNDLGDIKGDKVAGRRTIPIVLGGENTIKLLIILLGSMPAISWIFYAQFVHGESVSAAMITPIAVTIVALLAILRMLKVQKVFRDPKLMREQHKKWFPLHLVLQSGMVIGFILLL